MTAAPQTHCMNFGTENHFWSDVLKSKQVQMYEGTQSWEYICDGRIDELKKIYSEDHEYGTGRVPNAGVLTRWVGLSKIIRDENPYRVLHNDNGFLYWADTIGEWIDLGTRDVRYKYDKTKRDTIRMIARPTVNGWSNKTKAGKSLALKDLHPMIERIISLRGTARRCSDENAAYIDALINDEDLTTWEQKREWRNVKAAGLTQKKNKSPVTNVLNDFISPLDYVPDNEEERKTPEGYVYVLSLKAYPGTFKVGHSKCVEDRIKSLQTGVPEPITVEYTAWFEGSQWGEKRVHDFLGRLNRVSGEWFKEPYDMILMYIKKAQEIEADALGDVE